MTKLQQFSFVCAPARAARRRRRAGRGRSTAHVDDYRRKRDRVLATTVAAMFEMDRARRRRSTFSRRPRRSRLDGVRRRRPSRSNVLIIPGTCFSGATRTSASATRRPMRNSNRGARFSAGWREDESLAPRGPRPQTRRRASQDGCIAGRMPASQVPLAGRVRSDRGRTGGSGREFRLPGP